MVHLSTFLFSFSFNSLIFSSKLLMFYKFFKNILLQIVDSDFNILNTRICPGCNNDRFVWRFSEAKYFMEQLRADENVRRHYYILGKIKISYSILFHTRNFHFIELQCAFALKFILLWYNYIKCFFS